MGPRIIGHTNFIVNQMSTMKTMINAWQRSQSTSHDDEELIKEMILKVQESEDYKEGQRAFTEKRKPKFFGK